MTTPAHPAVERTHPPRWLVTHLVNPVARRVVRHGGKLAEEVLLLRFTGRRSGHAFEIPISFRRIDGRLALFTSSRWRHNFHGGRDVELTLKGEIVPARATLLDDPTEVARLYGGMIDEIGLANAPRQLGLKIHVDRSPTTAELEEMVRASGLSIVWLDPLT